MELKKYLKGSGACAGALRWVGDRTLQQAWDECNRFDWMLWLYRRNNPNKIKCVKIAIYAAKLCVEDYKNKYPEDKRPEAAIAAAEKWLENPSEENARAADAAAYAAEAAADAAATADATIDATAAAHAARAAAVDVTYAAYAAAAAARVAAVYAACADNTTRAKIINYIRQLIPTISIAE